MMEVFKKIYIKDKETETQRKETIRPRAHSYIAGHGDTHTL